MALAAWGFQYGEPFFHVIAAAFLVNFLIYQGKWKTWQLHASSFFRSFFITNFTCLLQISGECWIDESFLYGNADSTVLPIFSKFGGLRWMGSLSSAFLLAPTVFFSIFTWAGPIGAWVVGFVQPSMCTGGMSRPLGSSSQHLMSNRRHPNITCIYTNREAGSFTMSVILSYQTPMSPWNSSSQWCRSIAPTRKAACALIQYLYILKATSLERRT